MSASGGMQFHEYLIRRLVAMAVTLWGIITLVFVISRVMPGDPAAVIAGPKATQEQLQAIRQRYGLNEPIHVQYVDYFQDLFLHQDLGMSIATQRPVVTELVLRYPATFELTTLAVLFALAAGIPLGVISGIEQNNTIDHASRIFAISGVSLPQFWAALIVQLIFYFHLGWIPVDGRITDGMEPPPDFTGMYLVDSLVAGQFDVFLNVAHHMVAPVILLSLGTLAQVTRITRSSMIDTLNTDYVEWSRAHGFRSRIVLMKHALRNAIMPTITAAGLSYGVLLGGSVIIEIIFNIQGIGLFLFNSVIASDFNSIVGVTILFALSYLIVNFIVDVIHTYMNPEVEASG